MSAIGLRWAALVMIGAAALAGACSDDPPATGHGNAAGEGGEAQAGEAGQATAGTVAVGGAGGQGEGGIAGMPHVPTPGEQCSACGATECAAELDACGANPECLPWLGCLSACTDAACVTKCDSDHADAARIYTGIYDCLCNQCEQDCTAVSACEKSTCVDDSPLEPVSVAPQTLAETGLFAGYEVAEGGAGGGGSGGAPSLDAGVTPLTLAPYVRGFEPKYPLWADGATKDRFVYIPKCSTIDTSDMDHWKFPVGTRFWKTFSVTTNVGAANGTRVETRMLQRFGTGLADWVYAAYQWDVNAPDDPAAAMLVPNGVVAANGTTHDIPSTGQCMQCHNTLSEKVLGFGAYQLSHDTTEDDLTIAKISNLGWLTDPAPAGFTVPGTPVQAAALGYLHGNCGGCHHQEAALGAGANNNSTALVMRLLTGNKTYASTDTVKSAVGILTFNANVAINGKPRIDAAGDPANSAILLRMEARGVPLQMPPLGTNSTKLPDTDGGVADVTAWVESLQ